MIDVFDVHTLAQISQLPESVFTALFIALTGYVTLCRIYNPTEKVSPSYEQAQELYEETKKKQEDEFEKLLDEGSLVEAARDLTGEKIAGAPQSEIGPSTSIEEPLKNRLQKTRTGLLQKLKGLFSSAPRLNQEMLEELEYLLIGSDIGVATSKAIINELQTQLAQGDVITDKEVFDKLKSLVRKVFPESHSEPLEELEGDRNSPYIILVVGVNGVGKTTTCAKLASRLTERGLRVLLVAADTFRAAAVSQLEEWAQRISVPVVRGAENAKPQSVVFDGMKEALTNSYDVVIIDTAGRLQSKANLMQELEGIRNAVTKHFSEGPQESLLVLDGSTGQNAISQAKEFHQATPLTGLIITKLDGTPKGGAVVAIQSELGIPVRYIGVGESAADLRPFDPQAFVEAIFTSTADEPAELVSAHAETRRRRKAV